MGKLIFWAVIILALLMIARILAHRAAGSRQASRPASPHKSGAGVQPEPMVRCAHCAIHLPRSEAVMMNGQTWCSVEHARLGPPK